MALMTGPCAYPPGYADVGMAYAPMADIAMAYTFRAYIDMSMA